MIMIIIIIYIYIYILTRVRHEIIMTVDFQRRLASCWRCQAMERGFEDLDPTETHQSQQGWTSENVV